MPSATTAAPATQVAPNRRVVKLILLHCCFAVTGLATAFLGPFVPILCGWRALTLVEAGRLFTAQFLGAFLAATSTSWLVRRAGNRVVTSAAFAVMAVACAVLQFAPNQWLFVGWFFFGGGVGAAIPSVTLAVKAMYRQSSGAMNLLNVSWCGGAMLAGPFTLLPIGPGGFFFVQMLAALAAAIIVALLVGVSVQESGRAESRQLWPLALVAAAMLFIYVGTETALAGWAPTWAPTHRASISFSFWGGILCARLLAPLAFRFVSPTAAMAGGLLISTIALLFGASSGTVGLAGFGMGIVFPTVVAQFCDTADKAAERYTGIIYAAGSLGGATLPLTVGVYALGPRSLAGSLVILLILEGCLIWRIRMENNV